MWRCIEHRYVKILLPTLSDSYENCSLMWWVLALYYVAQDARNLAGKDELWSHFVYLHITKM